MKGLMECNVIEDKDDSLICDVIIRGEKKVISLHRTDYNDYYKSEEDVYVQIPPRGTRRSFHFSENDYQNKVRKAKLYVRKMQNEYNWLTIYKVMDGEADIVSWVQSQRGERFKDQEAMDYLIPHPKE